MMTESGASTQFSVFGVGTLLHSLWTSGSALTFWAGAAIIIRLMASAAAISIYITFTGHVLVLVIISSLYILYILIFTLA
jgi:hypothetical protein